MRLLNIAGTIFGYPLGLITGTVSFIRNSRMFHPVGIIAKAQVNAKGNYISFPPYALIRFSSAWWKNKEWIDVLGISVRFSKEIKNEIPQKEDQDLLFATIKHPWTMPFSPLSTHFRNFFENSYYAVSPFLVDGNLVYFKLAIKKSVNFKDNRIAVLKENIHQHAVMELWMRKVHEAWIPVAELTLLHELNLDQRLLRFNPFLNGLNIKPEGFVHHLRIGAYRLGQLGRSLRH